MGPTPNQPLGQKRSFGAKVGRGGCLYPSLGLSHSGKALPAQDLVTHPPGDTSFLPFIATHNVVGAKMPTLLGATE